MSPSPPLLFDAHHLGLGQTGNETWTRNMVAAMQPLATDGELEYAVTAQGRAQIGRITPSPTHEVSASSARRLVVDLPRLVRTTRCRAVLVTYTAPLTTCPAVVAVHDVSPWHPEARDWLPMATRVRHRVTVGISARRAAHVLVPSDATKHDVVARLGLAPARISVVPCAVDLELTRLLEATPPRPPDGRFRVLAVGTVVPRKNLLVLARAVKAGREAGLAAHLRLVGPVPASGRPILSQIREILGPAVDVVGHVDDAQLAVEYKSADVVCFPSLIEGFGMPVVEAMAAGVPVVVSDAITLKEVAGDAALVCPAHDPRAWREGLVRLQSDAAWRESLRRRGLARSSGFSWHHSAGVALDALRAAARGEVRGPAR